MVRFSSSTSAYALCQPPSTSYHQRSRAGGELQFQLTDHAGTKLLLRRQQLQHSSKSRGLLPLASLTTLGQQLQPFQQQPVGSSRASSKDTEGGQQRRGLINIGLLLQPAAQKQDAVAEEDNPTLQRHQRQQQCVVVAATAAASSKPHRAKHKEQHSSSQVQQQQECCLLCTATDSTKQPSQQQCKCQQDTSGTPIATLLSYAAQAKLLVAGAASAIVSRTAMAPLERVKMDLLLKTSSRSAVDTAVWVWQREGLAGFWKGNGLNLLRTAPFKALNFFSFDVYSKALSGMMIDGSNSARFIAGAMAGITATLVCFPLDVLRTRLMAPWGHKYGGPLTTLKCMVKFEGPGALYAGVVPAVIGMAPSGAVFYGVYDLLKARHLAKLNSSSTISSTVSTTGSSSTDSSSTSSTALQQHHELPVLYSLLYGALAGAAAETFLYPLEVIRRKMQLQSMAAGAAVLASPGNAAAAAAAAAPNLLRQHGLKAASGALVPSGAGMGSFGPAGVPGTAVGRIAAACSAIVRADGVAGFYAGLLPNMLQVLPSAALSYGTYESVKQMLGAV